MGEHLRSGRQMDKTLRDLSLRKEAPKSGFILLVFVYLIATVGTIFVSRNGGRLVGIFGYQVPFSAFAGVISSLANICIICLVVVYRKVGFFSALFLLVSNFPMLAVNIFVRRNVNNLPGFFMNMLTIVACLIIYFTLKKVLRYQQTLRDQAETDIEIKIPCAPLMEVSSKGLEIASFAACSALSLPEAEPMPMWA